MRVKVDGDIYVSGDGLGFTVEKKVIRNVKDKETQEVSQVEVFTTIGHYSSLEGCINGVVKYKISESNATTLQELLKEITEMRAEIRAIILI